MTIQGLNADWSRRLKFRHLCIVQKRFIGLVAKTMGVRLQAPFVPVTRWDMLLRDYNRMRARAIDLIAAIRAS